MVFVFKVGVSLLQSARGVVLVCAAPSAGRGGVISWTGRTAGVGAGGDGAVTGGAVVVFSFSLGGAVGAVRSWHFFFPLSVVCVLNVGDEMENVS